MKVTVSSRDVFHSIHTASGFKYGELAQFLIGSRRHISQIPRQLVSELRPISLDTDYQKGNTALYEGDEVSKEMARKEPNSGSTRRTASERREIVLRVLRGESIDEVARELNIPVHAIAQWKDDFIEAGTEGLKSQPVSLAEKRLKAAQAKIGQLSMQVEILQEYLKKKGLWQPRPMFGIF